MLDKIYFTMMAVLMCTCQLLQAQECNNNNPCVEFKGGNRLTIPRQLRSVRGQLNVVLQLDVAIVQFDWFRSTRRVFNRSVVAPTLRVKAGDTINIKLINNLEQNETQKSAVNSTNIHFYGLHVSPESNPVLDAVKPGKTRNYKLQIPRNHPSGTYLYQPTFQGSLLQTLSGTSGLLIIEDSPIRHDNPPQLKFVSCPLYCHQDIQLVLQPNLMYSKAVGPSSFPLVQREVGDYFRHNEVTTEGTTLERWLLHPDNKVQHFTVNGRIKPVMKIIAGQVKRFRLVNAGSTYTLELAPPVSIAGRKCDVREIAVDGIYLKQPRVVSSQTLLIPGGRVDWLIKCDDADVYSLQSKSLGRNVPSLSSSFRHTGQLMTIRVVTPVVTRITVRRFPSTLPSSTLPDLRRLDAGRINGRFVVEVSRSDLMNRESFSTAIKHKMPLNSVQEWTLLNPSSTRMIPVHIPVNFFQVVSYNKYNGPTMIHFSSGLKYFVDKYGRQCESQFYINKKNKGPNIRLVAPVPVPRVSFAVHQRTPAYNLGFVASGEWRSTIPIPPLSNITIRFVAGDYQGIVPIFSSNFQQKDQGMLMMTKVITKGGNVKIRTSAVKEFLPGTCHPGDWFPSSTSQVGASVPATKSTPRVTITSKTLLSFFNWLYKYYPNYKNKYGDQKYLSQLYSSFLLQSPTLYTDGNHLTDFFDWIYAQFPMYKTYYGDQAYLTELYNFYLNVNFTSSSS